MESDPLAWVWFVFTTVIPYLIEQTVGMVAAAVREHPAGLLLAALVALGLWQVVQAALWFLRKTWVLLLVAAVLAVALSSMGRL